jgi:hypothetical protein
VPARQGVEFGFRYKIIGQPVTVNLKYVTQTSERIHAGDADLAIRCARLAPRDASHETFRDQLSRAPTILADVL